jgi:hypothetical protein
MGSNQEVQAKQEKLDANQMKVKAGLEQMRVETNFNLKEIKAKVKAHVSSFGCKIKTNNNKLNMTDARMETNQGSL